MNKRLQDESSKQDKKYSVQVHVFSHLGWRMSKNPITWRRSKLESFDAFEIGTKEITLHQGKDKTIIDYNKEVAEFFS